MTTDDGDTCTCPDCVREMARTITYANEHRAAEGLRVILTFMLTIFAIADVATTSGAASVGILLAVLTLLVLEVRA